MIKIVPFTVVFYLIGPFLLQYDFFMQTKNLLIVYYLNQDCF